MSDYFSIRPLRPHWRTFFEDGVTLDLYPEPEKMAAEAHKVGEPPENIERFLKYSADRDDLWYVDGGLYHIALGLRRLMDELGIKVNLNAEVSEVRREGPCVTGLVVNGTFHPADIIVSNMEVIPAYEKLLRQDKAFIASLENYLKLKERILDKLERMGLKDLRKHVVFEHVWTPHDIRERYNSAKGSIYGVVSDRWKNLAFNAPKQSTKYPNLSFVGGSVNPGSGMPMVVLCGQNVAKKVVAWDE